MPNVTVKRYTKADIRANPDKLYVFGDNLERWGKGGQAKAARDEPNAVGIPTKRAPYKFLCDEDFPEWMENTSPDLRRIGNKLDIGGTVVWPADGLGTGRADLEAKAPMIWTVLQAYILGLGGPSK